MSYAEQRRQMIRLDRKRASDRLALRRYEQRNHEARNAIRRINSRKWRARKKAESLAKASIEATQSPQM